MQESEAVSLSIPKREDGSLTPEKSEVLKNRIKDADYDDKNKIIRDCLEDYKKRRVLDGVLGNSIESEMFQHSFVRWFLNVVYDKFYIPDQSGEQICSLTYSETTTWREKSSGHRDENRIEIIRKRGLDESGFVGCSIRNVFCMARFDNFRRRAYLALEKIRRHLAASLGKKEEADFCWILDQVSRKYGKEFCALKKESLFEVLNTAESWLESQCDQEYPNIGIIMNPIYVVDLMKQAGLNFNRSDAGAMAGGPFAYKRGRKQDVPVFISKMVDEGVVYALPLKRLGVLKVDHPVTMYSELWMEKAGYKFMCYNTIGMSIEKPEWCVRINIGRWETLCSYWRKLWKKEPGTEKMIKPIIGC